MTLPSLEEAVMFARGMVAGGRVIGKPLVQEHVR
jgi:hypothetical protein